MPSSNPANITSQNLDEYLNRRLTKDLENGVLNSWLELDPTEMNDTEISHRFRTATELASESLKIFVTIVTIMRDSTSIVARLATMRSLTNERSWPILIFAALLPLSQAVLKKVLPRKDPHPFWHRKIPI
jgi:hypothetical protein